MKSPSAKFKSRTNHTLTEVGEGVAGVGTNYPRIFGLTVTKVHN